MKRRNVEDWYSDYQGYIRQYPNSNYVEKVKSRLSWLKTQKAVIDCGYPPVVEMQDGYHNLEGPVWIWETVFKETAGRIGFKIMDARIRVVDVNGHSWFGGGIPRGSFKVPAGGSDSDGPSWRLHSEDHTLCNSTYHRTWTGEDAAGNPIKIEEVVKLSHKGCPKTGLRK